MTTSMTEKSPNRDDEEEQSRDIEVQGQRERVLSRVMNYRGDARGRGNDGETRVKIPKVGWEVSDKECYEPEIVSIGPYHCRKSELICFNELKDEFAFTFFGEKEDSPYDKDSKVAAEAYDEKVGKVAQEAYDRLCKVAAEARGYYSEDALVGMTDEVFTEVMFFDGCFVLEFMSRLQQIAGLTTKSKLDIKRTDSVVRDLFLLDNQVPFIVLQALDRRPSDSLASDAVNLFAFAFSYYMFPGVRYYKSLRKAQPTHLLDALSSWLNDPRDKPPRILPAGDEWVACPSVTRLEEAGIDCLPTQSPRVTAIGFTPKIVTAELKIPPMYVGEDSKPCWMNLAAYQIYAAGAGAGDEGARPRRCYIGAAEYVWMMAKLIDDAKDVKKLRAKQIILHSLGDHDRVVDLLQTMSQNITNDFLGMSAKFPVPRGEQFDGERLLMEEIQNHLRSKFKRWGYRNLYHPYCRSAWSIPAFFAGIIGLVLTFLQVYYAIYPRY